MGYIALKSLILLAVIFIATFGAGAVDVLFPDVIPLRPYTGVFQTAHSIVGFQPIEKIPAIQLPAMFLFMAIATLVLVVASILYPQLSLSLCLAPLGSRGSHSRANRRASGAGWKDTSQKQPLTSEEQFRILMQIFGKPRMVIVYGKEEKKK